MRQLFPGGDIVEHQAQYGECELLDFANLTGFHPARKDGGLLGDRPSIAFGR